MLGEFRSIPLKKDAPSEKHDPAATVLDDLRRRETKLVTKLKRLYDLYAEADDAILLETIDENNTQLREIRSLIQAEAERGMLSEERGKIRKEIEDVSDLWDYMTVDEQRSFLRKIINRVTVKSRSITIDYNF